MLRGVYRGAVSLIIGSKSAFNIPTTAAEINALLKWSICTPIGSLEIIKKLIAVTNQVIINPIRKTPGSQYVSINERY